MSLVRAAITPTISTTEYAPGDAVGSQMQFDLGANRGLILGCRVLDRGRQSAPLELWLFRASTTGTGLSNNDPFAPSDTQLANLAGVIRINDWFLSAASCVGQAEDLPFSFTDLTGGAFYGWLVNRGRPGYVSAGDLTVELEADQAPSSINRRRRVYWFQGKKRHDEVYAVGTQLQLGVGADSGAVVGCQVFDKTRRSAPLELWLFRSPTTGPGLFQGAPFAPTDAQVANLAGVLRIVDWSAGGATGVGQAENLPLPFGGLTSGTFYGWLVTRGRATYSSTDLTVTLQVERAGSSVNRRQRVYYYPRPHWRSQLRMLFGGRLTQKSDFQAFIDRFQQIIADPSSLQREAFDFIDRCGWNPGSGDGKIDYSDLLFWLSALLKANLPASPRLPTTGNGWSANPGDSDPLGLRALAPSGTQVIIVDPQNTNSRYTVRGSAQSIRKSSDDTADGNLWTQSDGNTYKDIVLSSLKDFDEYNWGDTSNSPRRFPKNAGQQVVILLRGGDHPIDKEIEIKRVNGNWERPDRIHIMGYPGESPTLYCGSSLIEAGEPGATYAGSYRLFMAFNVERHALLMENIEWVGYRDSGGDRIFAHHLVRVGLSDGGATPPHIRNCIFRDSRGFSPLSTNPDGNVIKDNILRRLDATTTMLSVQTGAATCNFYTLAQISSTFTACTGNTGDDPLFVDPAAGDFRWRAGSPATAYLSPDTPLTSVPPWNLNPLSILR